jgi:hypothetical protein
MPNRLGKPDLLAQMRSETLGQRIQRDFEVVLSGVCQPAPSGVTPKYQFHYLVIDGDDPGVYFPLPVSESFSYALTEEAKIIVGAGGKVSGHNA